VGRAEERSVGEHGEPDLLGTGLDERHVAPTVVIDPAPCAREHLGARLDADDPARGADSRLEELEVQTRATAHLDDDLAGAEVQLRDRQAAVHVSGGGVAVVAGGVASVAAAGQVAIGPAAHPAAEPLSFQDKLAFDPHHHSRASRLRPSSEPRRVRARGRVVCDRLRR
jgi:hypothetical protein